MTTPLPPRASILFYLAQLVLVLSSKTVRSFAQRLVLCLMLTAVLGYTLFPVPGPPSRKLVSKVFGIGLSRTGTTSITKAMHNAGYVSVHAPLNMFNYSSGSGVVLRDCVDGYDFIGDIMPSLKFQELATMYPDAKFVLTTRMPSSFASSAYKFFAPKAKLWKSHDYAYDLGIFPIPTNRFFAELYGKDYLDYSVSEWETFAQNYHERVTRFFSSQSERLLILNIPSGEGWEKLGPFLGIDQIESASGNFPKVDVFESVIEQSFWGVKNLLGWIHYYVTR